MKIDDALETSIDLIIGDAWRWKNAESHSESSSELQLALRKTVRAELEAARAAAMAEAAKDRADAERLDWVLSHPYHRVQGNDKTGWAVMDCSNGLTFVVRNEGSAREAIDAAIAAGGAK